MPSIEYSGDVAIIGMSGAFPGARTVDEFWKNLCEGQEMIRHRPSECDSGSNESGPRFVRAVAAMDDVELFDASFFGMTPTEAELTDPQHRILLEHAWRAFENAGYDSQRCAENVGVFAGATINTYLIRNLASNRELMEEADPIQINIGNGSDFLTTRISYKLGFKGPSHTLQSACSTSLVAVHCACRALLDLECDMALAGGVSVNVDLMQGYRYREGGILSPDGHCRVFDATAQGTVFGSGVGVVVLKRLEDALKDDDCIHAVIKGSAVNNDGPVKASYTAPSVEGQSKVISEALGNAGVSPESIGYVECHGTGTLLGDPVEIRALNKAFQSQTSKQGFCAVGSVKSNVGHLDAAAGITGLIKVVHSLKHGLLPPSLHFHQPNPQIDFAHSPFYVNTQLREWKSTKDPRRAGVSAFGVGGTNVHVIVEEAPKPEKNEGAREWHLVVVSARTAEALRRALQNLGEHLSKAETEEEQASLGDVAYTLQVGRRAFGYRWSGVFREREEAVAELRRGEKEGAMMAVDEGRRKIAFLFPGQGSQYKGMGRELYEKEAVFRESMEECEELLRPHLGVKLCELLYGRTEGETEEVDQTWISQPALVAVEYSLARLWMAWGIKPEGMLGHGIGEYTAACVAGVMSLKDVLGVVAELGKLMQEIGRGGMLAVELGEKEIRERLRNGLGLAAVNAEDVSVVSGALEAVEELERELRRVGISCKRLQTSHAFHSEIVEPILGRFLARIKQVRLQRPEIPFISNVTGTWIGEEEAQAAEYWVRHLRETVQFASGVRRLSDRSEWMLVEAGPGAGLAPLVEKESRGRIVVVGSLPGASRDGSEVRTMLQGVGELWGGGHNVEWNKLFKHEKRRRVPLPTYPFERKRHWIEPYAAKTESPAAKPEIVPAKEAETIQLSSRPVLRNSYVPPKNEAERKAVSILEKALGVRPVGVTDIYGELGGDSLTAIKIIEQINAAFHCSLRVIDLYEGLSVLDLIQLIQNDSRSSDDRPKSDSEERRRLYRAVRRQMHKTESV